MFRVVAGTAKSVFRFLLLYSDAGSGEQMFSGLSLSGKKVENNNDAGDTNHAMNA